MESGGIVRTMILIGLFVVLVCDYSTLIMQVYNKYASGNISRPFFAEDEGDGSQHDLNIRNPHAFREDNPNLHLDADIDFKKLNLFGSQSRAEVIATIKNACLPKLICELSSGTAKRRLTEGETGLLKLISDTSLGTMAEVTSKYHFAAHMGQLISGMEGGAGCHTFYPSCPLPGIQVLHLMKEVRLK